LVAKSAVTAPVVPQLAKIETPVAVSNSDRIQQVLIAIIAEKTGYPPEMLGLDMGLDADLGIDSIKRVEILSALQDKLPEAPVVKPEHLGTLTTIRLIAAFLAYGEPAASTRAADSPVVTSTESFVPLDRRVLRVADLPPSTRSLRHSTGSTLVWIVGSDDSFAQQLRAQIGSRGYQPQTFLWTDLPPGPAALGGLVLIASPTASELPKRALRWLQHAGPALRQSQGFLASITELDGMFGLSEAGPS